MLVEDLSLLDQRKRQFIITAMAVAIVLSFFIGPLTTGFYRAMPRGLEDTHTVSFITEEEP